MNDYIYRAKQFNRDFELTSEQFDILTKSQCHYCGEFSEGKDFCGIDRVDSKKGYTIKNSISCCEECNHMKSDSTMEEFFNKCLKIVNKHLEEDIMSDWCEQNTDCINNENLPKAIIEKASFTELLDKFNIEYNISSSGNFSHKMKCPLIKHSDGQEKTASCYFSDSGNGFWCYG